MDTIYFILLGLAVFVLFVTGLIYTGRAAIEAAQPKPCECPECHQKGKLVGSGRFRCGSCGASFIVNDRGSVVQNLKPLIRTQLIMAAVVVGLGLYGALTEKNKTIWSWSRPLWYLGIAGCFLHGTVKVKKFPTETPG